LDLERFHRGSIKILRHLEDIVDASAAATAAASVPAPVADTGSQTEITILEDYGTEEYEDEEWERGYDDATGDADVTADQGWHDGRDGPLGNADDASTNDEVTL